METENFCLYSCIYIYVQDYQAETLTTMICDKWRCGSIYVFYAFSDHSFEE
jgi:hypothetical protein